MIRQPPVTNDQNSGAGADRTIGGDWDAEAGWDLDGRFTVLADDGVILAVNGWMAGQIELL